MAVNPQLPDKPRSEFVHPDITRLPKNNFWQKLVRSCCSMLARLIILLFTRPDVTGMENFPNQGPAILIYNHLGDLDTLLGMAFLPGKIDGLAKADLYDLPIIGKLLDAYGVIWVHRGQPDRKALRAALDGLEQGRIISISPEARESLSGALESGTPGAAYLAVKSKAPLYPITLTGTENRRIYRNLKKLRRTPVTMKIGKKFSISQYSSLKESVERGTEQIMIVLARQLPVEYQGVYQDHPEVIGEH